MKVFKSDKVKATMPYLAYLISQMKLYSKNIHSLLTLCPVKYWNINLKFSPSNNEHISLLFLIFNLYVNILLLAPLFLYSFFCFWVFFFFSHIKVFTRRFRFYILANTNTHMTNSNTDIYI